MSRIGKMPIELPGGVEVSVSASNFVVVKGPKGELVQQVDRDLKIEIENGVISLFNPTNQKRHKAMHGLYRTLISNMVTGVSAGHTRQLEMVGVGYRANSTGQILELMIGFSHPIFLALPNEVSVSVETVKGKNPIITLESIDKQLIGQVAAKIRSLRKPEPYKGKGIKYVGEVLRRKAGKTAAK